MLDMLLDFVIVIIAFVAFAVFMWFVVCIPFLLLFNISCDRMEGKLDDLYRKYDEGEFSRKLKW